MGRMGKMKTDLRESGGGVYTTTTDLRRRKIFRNR